MQYQIVTAESSAKVQLLVDGLMKTGWTPIGGVSVYVLDETAWFAQAMTKSKEEEPYSARALLTMSQGSSGRPAFGVDPTSDKMKLYFIMIICNDCVDCDDPLPPRWPQVRQSPFYAPRRKCLAR